MLFTTVLTTLFATLPSTLSAPIEHPEYPGPMCGFVLTAPDENVFLSLHHTGGCLGFYNGSSTEPQEAYAYNIFAGCRCAFYTDLEYCETQGHKAIFHEGPTKEEMWETIPFEEPRPLWHVCLRDGE